MLSQLPSWLVTATLTSWREKFDQTPFADAVCPVGKEQWDGTHGDQLQVEAGDQGLRARPGLEGKTDWEDDAWPGAPHQVEGRVLANPARNVSSHPLLLVVAGNAAGNERTMTSRLPYIVPPSTTISLDAKAAAMP